jgi:antitoxin component of MazEF toxin-antitoxin module
MPLLKKLTPIGNSMGLILDRPLLNLVGIDENTLVQLTTKGGSIIVRAAKGAVRASARKVIKAHHATLKRLADS